jgi:CHAT domain-containing protein/tetratricopeptide (TPR) repeat protein
MREIAACLGAAWLASQATAPPATRLSAGTSIERRLGPGETHKYDVQLPAGHFLHVVVEQRALDAIVRLADPDGTTIVDADSPNGEFGFERVAFIAPREGVYRIEVRAATPALVGDYALAVRAWRAATSDDRRHEAAERRFLEANVQRGANTADSRRQAVAAFGDAADGFAALGLDYELALAHFSRGFTRLAAGETRAAVGDLTSALPIVQARTDPLLPSVVNMLGGAYDILGDLDRAMASYREAQAFFHTRGNRNGEASALNNIGKVYSDLAEWQPAIAQYRAALPLLRAQRNAAVEGTVLHNIGVAYERLGDPVQALDYFEQALVQRRAARDKGGEADTLSAMGAVETRRGDTRRALEHYDRALPLRREVGNRRSEAITLNEVGRTYMVLGDASRALDLFEQARDLHRASGDRRNEAVSLGNIAAAAAALKRHDAAIEAARSALATFREIGDRSNAAGMLFVAAGAERDLDRLDAAARDARDALAAIEDVRSRVASTDLRSSYFARQHDVYDFYVDVLMRRHDREPASGYDRQALEASERARARSLLDSLSDTGAHVSSGADTALVERERRIGTQMNVKADRLMRLAGRASAASEAAALDRDIRALENEANEVRAEIRRTSPAYAALTQPQPMTVADMQRELDDDTVLLQYSLGSPASYLWAVSRAGVSSYRLPDEQTIGRAVGDVRELVTGRRTASTQAALRTAVARLSAIVLAPAAPLLAGKRVAVVPDAALQYVPFAMLVASARAGAARAPLVTTAEVVTLPSMSALAAQRAQMAGRARPPHGIAVLADPVFDAQDPRASKVSTAAAAPPAPDPAREEDDDAARLLAHLLPAPGDAPAVIPRLRFTRTEAASILRAAGGAKHLEAVGFDASKDLVLSGALREYRYVHFATHGYLDAERSALSAIVLSQVDREGRRTDGFLRAHELYNLDLPADLIVLSACETGLGRDVRGEGLIGLTRGFMYAGAARVVVSLWPVSDRATAALMGVFYDQMLQKSQTPAAALRSAQLAIMKQPRWQHPYYWAGFVLEGEWR